VFLVETELVSIVDSLRSNGLSLHARYPTEFRNLCTPTSKQISQSFKPVKLQARLVIWAYNCGNQIEISSLGKYEYEYYIQDTV
jgi:hypothetical protein